MRKMKDSRVQWIGSIPSTWDTIRLKFLHDGMNTGEAIGKEFWSTNENDIPFYTAGMIPIKTSFTDFPEWKFTTNSDMLLARNGTPYVYVPIEHACYTDHIIRVQTKSHVNRRFVQYSLQQAISKAVVDTVSIATWSASLWNEQTIPWPANNVQEKIVSYLDRRCATIDALIANQQQQIEKLKQYKQAVITEAVTRGLDPNVQMKDSGVEWIGAVPEHWNIAALKRFVTIKAGITLGGERTITPDMVERPYLRVANVQSGGVDLSKVTTLFVTPDEDMKYRLEAGDVLMTEGGDRDKLGRGCVWKGQIDPCLHQNHVFAVHVHSNLLAPSFLEYVTVSTIGRQYFDVTAIKTTNLACTNASKVLAFIMPIPSRAEQDAIIYYLDTKCAQIDALIAVKQQKADKLAQYKKSLIYEVVTGKREISQ